MQKKISIFSFFAGIGILDLAFEKSGYNIVFVNEYDDLFMASYQYARTQMTHLVPLYGYHNDSAERYAKKRGKRKLINHTGGWAMKKIVIDPRVIKHLGRDLITSPEVAVIELVKNSIDAKAKHINLRLYNNYSHYESLPNYVRAAIPKQYLDLPMLIVEDDGRGMTNAALDDGFLSFSKSRRFQSFKEAT